MAVLKSDPEMRLESAAEAATPDGHVIRYENAGLAIWTAYSGSRSKVWFDHRRGHIVVKNPDEEIIRKMWQLADALSAKVQGSDGEFYNRHGRLVPR
ncbi:MAG TPA: hypothetical protein VMD99_17330 [Terriglobales bacterium]|nr:hypothetical protein [Terriglobales bacterium]